jgi:hypothetical protein
MKARPAGRSYGDNPSPGETPALDEERQISASLRMRQSSLRVAFPVRQGRPARSTPSRAGDVLDEDQAEDYMLGVRYVPIVAKAVEHDPKCRFKTI